MWNRRFRGAFVLSIGCWIFNWYCIRVSVIGLSRISFVFSSSHILWSCGNIMPYKMTTISFRRVLLQTFMLRPLKLWSQNATQDDYNITSSFLLQTFKLRPLKLLSPNTLKWLQYHFVMFYYRLSSYVLWSCGNIPSQHANVGPM